jgi:hypothetical protein
MSGRGKGGKSLGSCAKKARVEPYEWTSEEEVATVSTFTPDDRDVSNYIVPLKRLPNELAVALTQKRQCSSSSGCITTLLLTLGDGAAEENFDLFDHLSKGDLGCDRDDDNDDEDDELDEDGKQTVVESLEEWVASKLDLWSKSPTTAVRVCAAVNIVDTN